MGLHGQRRPRQLRRRLPRQRGPDPEQAAHPGRAGELPQTAATLEQWVALNQQARVSPPAHAFWQSYQGLSLRDPFFTGRVAFRQALTRLVSSLRVANTLLQGTWPRCPGEGQAGRLRRAGRAGDQQGDQGPRLLLAGDAGLPLPESLPFHLAWGGIPFSKDVTALPAWRDQEPKGHPGAAGRGAVLRRGVQPQLLQVAGGQGHRRQRGPEREAGGAESLRQATEEINKVLVEAYPQG